MFDHGQVVMRAELEFWGNPGEGRFCLAYASAFRLSAS